MSKVLVTAKLENLHDWNDVTEGFLTPEKLRSVEVADAVVDTRFSTLIVPTPLIVKLGLRKARTTIARGIGGRIPMDIYGTVRLTVQGRECALEVAEIPNSGVVIVGRIALDLLDLVLDSASGRLIGNSEHGGEAMIDAFSCQFNEPVQQLLQPLGLSGHARQHFLMANWPVP
jgi:predicted aspartyl protease